MSSTPAVIDSRFEIDAQGVATLTLQRDEVRNTLTGTSLIADITATCEWVNAHHEVGALVLTGEGKAFSAGGNLREMQARRGTYGGTPIENEERYRRGIQRMTRALHGVEVPVIAAINGAAVGAGLGVCCMCDIRLAAAGARLAASFVNLGIIAGDGSAWFLPRLVGQQRAAELLFSARFFTAEEALEMGLVMEVLPQEALLARARELAALFASKSRHALRHTKRLLQSGQRLPLGDFLDHCASVQSLCHATDEHAAALEALPGKP